MYYTTKIFSFAMAHNLLGHNGLCKNFHGHNYKLHVTIKSNNLTDDSNKQYKSSSGMVMDFSDLKRIVERYIINIYDHSLLLWDNNNETNNKLYNMLLEASEEVPNDSYDINKDSSKIWRVSYRPTAENMCYHFYKILKDYIEQENNNPIDIRLHSIKIYETDTAYAEYIGEE